MHKAVREIVGNRRLIRRCQWHKRENIGGRLPKSDRKEGRRNHRYAYRGPIYVEAKAALSGKDPGRLCRLHK